MQTARRARGRWIAVLAALSTLAATTLAQTAVAASTAADPAGVPQVETNGGGPEAIARPGMTLRTTSSCGLVYLSATVNYSDPTLQSRLPMTVTVSEPSRGLGATAVTTINPGTPVTSFASPNLFATSPTGRGPGLTVTLSWAGGTGTDTFTTEPYVDNCPGSFFPTLPTRLLDTRTGVGTASGTPGVVAAGTFIEVDPVGAGNVPSAFVTALVLNVTATESTAPGYLTVYPCGQTPPTASNVNYGAGQTVPNLVVVDLVGFPATGRVCIYAFTTTHVLADVTGYYLAAGINPGGEINALPSPQRLLDTRSTAAVPAGQTIRVPMAGKGGIPATGATAVAMNLTATDALNPGFLTAYPCDTPQPNASNVNFVVNTPVPNAAIVGLGTQGDLCVFASQTTHVVIDVGAYMAPTGLRYLPAAPSRLFDSRTTPSSGQTAPRKLAAGGTFRYSTGFPAGSAFLLNVTITDADSGGYATVFPCDQGVPNASNLNFGAGAAIANTVLVRADAAGDFCLFSTARTNFIFDLNGLALSLAS